MRWKAAIITIVAWQLVSWGVMALYPQTIQRLVHVLCVALLGDLQANANISTFLRINEYTFFLVTTTIATAICVPFYDFLTGRRRAWKSRAMTLFAWLAGTFTTLIWSYETAFFYRINMWSWDLFGMPEETYSFRNLILPRMIAWFMSTIPIGIVSLWLHGKLPERRPVSESPSSTET